MTDGVCRFALRGPDDAKAARTFSHFDVCIRGALELQLLGYLASGYDLADIAEQWTVVGDRAVDPIVGDFALVVWDQDRRKLWLARGPLSSNPLYFRTGEREIRVGTLAHEIAGSRPQPNLPAIARWYGALSGTATESMFDGVTLVAPGTVVSIDADGCNTRRFWDAGSIGVVPLSDHEAADGLRLALKEAVSDCIGQCANVATLLSSGRDSSAVTAVAAVQMAESGRDVHSFTASPGPESQFRSADRLMDEAPQAAVIAARYPNIDHHVVVPRGFRFCAEVEEYYRFHSTPMGLPTSLHWWQSAQRAAHEAGCDILLTGGMGNLTISDGGPLYLSDIFSSGRLGIWWRAITDAASFEDTSWLSLFNWSFGGRIPKPIYNFIQRVTGRRSDSEVVPFLRGPLRNMVLESHEAQDQRPRPRSRGWGAEILNAANLVDSASRHRYGLIMRDPTADRRVVEAVLRIAPEQLVSRYDRRPIFKAAFGDLLPEETVTSPRRAIQSADWNFAYDLDDLKAGLDKYRDHPLVAEMLDVEQMEAGLRKWPTDRLASGEERSHIGLGLLRAFALAAFFYVHFPDDRAG